MSLKKQIPPLHCANGGGTEYEQQGSGLCQVMKSQVNGSLVPSPPRPAGAWEVKSQGNSISEQAVYAEGFMSFKFCVAGDWYSLFLEFGAGFLILPTRTPSLPNNTIASCLLYKCFQDSTGQNLKVWWFLKVVPTWTLLKEETLTRNQAHLWAARPWGFQHAPSSCTQAGGLFLNATACPQAFVQGFLFTCTIFWHLNLKLQCQLQKLFSKLLSWSLH